MVVTEYFGKGQRAAVLLRMRVEREMEGVDEERLR